AANSSTPTVAATQRHHATVFKATRAGTLSINQFHLLSISDPHFLPVFIGRDAQSSVSTFTNKYARVRRKVPKKVMGCCDLVTKGVFAVTNIYVKDPT